MLWGCLRNNIKDVLHCMGVSSTLLIALSFLRNNTKEIMDWD
uniref:Uncharacterized protein n=1 Tax=Arundo donax TaxID=35708 RepID=A0A0A9A529_ARUDO